MTDHDILVSFQEIRILLYVRGVREIQGIYMPEHKYTDQEVVDTLHGMVKNQFIRVENEEFVLREDLEKILEIMSQARESFILDPYFCYLMEASAVVCERYWKKKEMLRIMTFSREAFEEWKLENGLEDKPENNPDKDLNQIIY